MTKRTDTDRLRWLGDCSDRHFKQVNEYRWHSKHDGLQAMRRGIDRIWRLPRPKNPREDGRGGK